MVTIPSALTVKGWRLCRASNTSESTLIRICHGPLNSDGQEGPSEPPLLEVHEEKTASTAAAG